MDVADARQLAFWLLADDLPDRWLHVKGVAATAKRLAPLLDDWETLVMAGYLHDIGYSPKLPRVGFHPLDGARYLKANGWPAGVINLVANHSNAEMQALINGFAPALYEEFPYDPDLPHLYLQYCDLSVDVDGRPVSLDVRLAGMLDRHRYSQGMTKQVIETAPGLQELVADVDEELRRAGTCEALDPLITVEGGLG